MNNRIFLMFFLFFIGCKPYYNSTKVYYNDVELVNKSSSLIIKSPFVINFSGEIGDSIKTYDINGLLKVISLNRFQIFLFSKTFGVEIGRIDFNEDQVFYIDKFNKRFFKGSISDFKYLKDIELNANQILKLVLGRLFYDVNLIKKADDFSFVYNDFDFTGSGLFNTFGYLKMQKFETGSFSIDLSFDDYYLKNDLPSRINGIIMIAKSKVSIDLNYSNISNINVNINDFVLPNNFIEIL